MGKGSEQALRLRRVGIDTYRENVAYLHRDCPVYRTDGFQALARVEIAAAGQAHGQAQAHAHGRALDQAHDQAHDQAQAHGQARTPHHGHLARVQAILNVVDDAGITAPDELGLSEQAFSQLGLPAGARVTLAHAEPPESLSAVRRKIAGARLEEADYLAIAQDMVAHRFSKMEIAAFLVASSQGGLDRDEILYLTRAMVATGERLEWGEEIVVDKHCIGGIPGNRTSMLVVPIVAAHGMLIPKTSSRAITSPAGTADTMELLADVELSPDRLREIVRHHRGCLAWACTPRWWSPTGASPLAGGSARCWSCAMSCSAWRTPPTPLKTSARRPCGWPGGSSSSIPMCAADAATPSPATSSTPAAP